MRSALINILIKLDDRPTAIRELKALKDIEPSLTAQIDATIAQLQAKKR